jgi:hypothetical protein
MNVNRSRLFLPKYATTLFMRVLLHPVLRDDVNRGLDIYHGTSKDVDVEWEVEEKDDVTEAPTETTDDSDGNTVEPIVEFPSSPSVSTSDSDDVYEEPQSEMSVDDGATVESRDEDMATETSDMRKTGGGSDRFGCKKCPKFFSRFSKLRDHMNTHVSYEQLPYKCEDCPRRYASSWALTTHKRRRHT